MRFYFKLSGTMNHLIMANTLTIHTNTVGLKNIEFIFAKLKLLDPRA